MMIDAVCSHRRGVVSEKGRMCGEEERKGEATWGGSCMLDGFGVVSCMS